MFEKQLQTEQKQWTTKLSEIRREVTNLEAKLPTLQENSTKLTKELSEKQSEIAEIDQKIAKNRQELSKLDDKLWWRNKECDDALEKLTETREELTRIKGKINYTVTQYEEDQKKIVDDKFETSVSELKAIEDAVNDANKRLNHAREEYQTVISAIEDAKKQHVIDKEQLKDDVADLISKKLWLEEQIEAEETKLKELQAENVQVNANTLKAEQRHNQFIEYEKGARKILEAKQTALTRRQEDIAQQEKFIKARRAILPEM